jgi:mRNA interferase MazF
MRRGEVWWVDFDPSLGGETRQTRPAIILSNNAAVAALNRIQVVPMTSNTGRLYPSEAIVHIDGKASKAMADQLTTVSKLRLKGRLGVVAASEMRDVERVVLIQLGIPL